MKGEEGEDTGTQHVHELHSPVECVVMSHYSEVRIYEREELLPLQSRKLMSPRPLVVIADDPLQALLGSPYHIGMSRLNHDTEELHTMIDPLED